MELTTITVRTASRYRTGTDSFHELGVALTFAVRGEEAKNVDDVMEKAGTTLGNAFSKLWKILDEEE